MFNRICIKSKELNNQKIDIGFLVDTMLFYGKVIVLVHKDEIITLLNIFGEEFLEELIKTGRIELRVREDILGSMAFPGDRYNVNLLSKTDETYSGILYQAHRSIVNNSSKNIAFSDKFSKITYPFRYENDITTKIRDTFNNQNLLKKLLPIYINSRVPTYQIPAEIEVEILNDESFGPFAGFSLKTNLDLIEINKIHQENEKANYRPFDYSGFFLSLAESQGDIFIASQFESELVTTELYSKFINQQFTEIIQKRANSQENLKLFDEYVLYDCHAIGEAFVNGIVSKKEILKLFEKADRFRDWLLKVPEEKHLIGEYHKAVSKDTLGDKLPTKTVRFMIFEGIGIVLDIMGAGGIGTAAATSLSAFDSFYLDKLINGWKPNHFIDNNLKPLTKIRSK